MKIYRLLQLDAACTSEQSLPLSFGDSYLFRHNRIFRNIRLAAMASGFAFNSEPDAAYFALPLSQLENIMSGRQIPYVNNVGVLLQLEQKCPQGVEWFEISGSFKKNFVFHESCHAAARNVFGLGNRAGMKLALLMEESFANTCELFGILDAGDQAHRIFYDCNSYTSLYELRTNLKRACEEIGEATVFQFFVLGYLHSNFLNNSFSDSEFQTVQSQVENGSGSKLRPSQIKTVRALLKVCFTLDLDFRTTTTGLHLKLSGKASPLKAGDFSYFKELEADKEFFNGIQRVTLLALEGRK